MNILKCWTKRNIKYQHLSPFWAPLIDILYRLSLRPYSPLLSLFDSQLCSPALWPIHVSIPRTYHKTLTKLVPNEDLKNYVQLQFS